MFGNVPDKALKVGKMSADGRTLDLIADQPHVDERTGRTVRGWSVIRFDGRARYVWESGSFPEGAPDQRTARFRDDAKRSPP
jgi:hypothetical protein